MKRLVVVIILVLSFISIDVFGATVTVDDTEVSLICSDYSHGTLGDVSLSGMSVDQLWKFTLEEVSGSLVLDDLDFYIRATPPSSFPDGFVHQGLGIYKNIGTNGSVNLYIDIDADERINGAYRNCRFGYKTWSRWHSEPQNYTWVNFQISVDDLSISGTTLACNSPNSSFTVSGYPSNPDDLYWSKSSNLTYVSGSSSATYTVRAASSSTSGSGYVIAYIDDGTCEWSKQKQVWVGKPATPADIACSTGSQCDCCAGDNIEYFVTDNTNWASITDYYWTLAGGTIISGQGTDGIYAEASDFIGAHLDVGVRAENTCGNSSYIYEYGEVQSCGGGPMRAAPNPTDTYVEISFDETELAKDGLLTTSNTYDFGENAFFRIIDKFGVVQIIHEYGGEKVTQINTSKLQQGVYTVQFITKDKIFSQNLLISR